MTAASSSTARVPSDPTQGVTVNGDVGQLKIGLPEATKNGEGRNFGGTTVYPGQDHSANAVVPVRSGVQLLTVIGSKDASSSYNYPVNVPDGGRLIAAGNGAAIVDKNGTLSGYVKSPWAKDTRGRNVPTRFEVSADGKSLTQHVDHKGMTDLAYPVVADPVVFLLMGFFVKCFLGGSWELRNTHGEIWWVRLWGATWGVHSLVKQERDAGGAEQFWPFQHLIAYTIIMNSFVIEILAIILVLSIGYLLAIEKRLIASVALGVAAVLYGCYHSAGDWTVGVFAAAFFTANTIAAYFVLAYVTDRHHRT